MKKMFAAIMTVITIFTMMLTFTGCEDVPTCAISLVLGNHRHFPKINLYAESVYQKIYDAAYSYGDCSVVVVDGNPYVSASYNITEPDKTIDNSKRKQMAKQNTEQIINEASIAVAKTAEIDTLSALIQAASLLNASGAEKKELLVYDSGFSTSGLLNFSSENLIDVEPSLIAERLAELHSIPELDGITVIWTGLGEVCGEQEELSATYKHNLENIWCEIIVAGGGIVDFIDVPLSASSISNELPSCTAIPIVQDTLELGGEIKKCDVKFLSDKAVFVDEEVAKDTLTPVANDLLKNRNKTILMVGTTASSGGEESCEELSCNRAEACKKLLIEMGVYENQIQTVGLGRKECFLRANDLDSSGNLIESSAKLNRAVFVMDITSDSAQKVLSLSE